MGRTLLITDQGKTAVRIAQAAADLGWASVALAELCTGPSHGPGDPERSDEESHSRWMDAEPLLKAAAQANAGHVHPGTGALSLDPGFVRRCARDGLMVIGPPPGVLEIINSRSRVRALADAVGVPVTAGPAAPVSWAEAEEFLASLHKQAMLLRPVSDRWAQGPLVVRSQADLRRAHDRLVECGPVSEPAGLYVEEFVERARRVEVQIAGDGWRVAHLWERQPMPHGLRRSEWLAPAAGLPPATRFLLLDAALRVADAIAYHGVGTVTFLLTPTRRFFLTGIKPHLHNGHFVTERLAGVDLFATQLRLSRGDTIGDLGLEENLRPSLPLPDHADHTTRPCRTHVHDRGHGPSPRRIRGRSTE